MDTLARRLHMIIQEVLEDWRVVRFEHLDSLGRLELLTEIEEELDKNMDLSVLQGVDDIGSLVDNIIGYIGTDV